MAGILPAAQVDEIQREAEREHEIARLVCVTAWSWTKAHDVLTEAKCLGLAAEELIAEAGHRGPDAALDLVARARVQIPELTLSDVRRAAEQLQAENPHQDHYELPVFVEPAPPDDVPETAHSFRVGGRLARHLGDRR